MNWIKLTENSLPPENVPVLLYIDGGAIEGYRLKDKSGHGAYYIGSCSCGFEGDPPKYWAHLPELPSNVKER